MKFGARMEEFIERSQASLSDFHFIIPTIPKMKASFPNYFKECCNLIEKNDIKVVIAICDWSGYILGALKKKFPYLNVPTIESFYLTMDKLLTRELIIPSKHNLKFHSVTTDLQKNVFQNLCEEVGLPSFLKPSNGTFSALIKKIDQKEDLIL